MRIFLLCSKSSQDFYWVKWKVENFFVFFFMGWKLKIKWKLKKNFCTPSDSKHKEKMDKSTIKMNFGSKVTISRNWKSISSEIDWLGAGEHLKWWLLMISHELIEMLCSKLFLLHLQIVCLVQICCQLPENLQIITGARILQIKHSNEKFPENADISEAKSVYCECDKLSVCVGDDKMTAIPFFLSAWRPILPAIL